MPSDYVGCKRGKHAQVRYARRLLHIGNDVTFISFTSLIISYAFGELNTYYCNFFIDEVELQEQCNFPTDIEALQVQCSNPTEVVALQGAAQQSPRSSGTPRVEQLPHKSTGQEDIQLFRRQNMNCCGIPKNLATVKSIAFSNPIRD